MTIRKQTKLRTTQRGNRIRICDMHDEHLKNAIAKIERTQQHDPLYPRLLQDAKRRGLLKKEN